MTQITDQEIQEWAANSKGRKVVTPLVSFSEYLESIGVKLSDIEPHPNNWGEAIFGSFNYCRTAREHGKSNSAKKRLVVYAEHQEAYQEAVKSGEIKTEDVFVPLNVEREDDAAYVRVRIRREKRKAARNA